jgi:hypothetical protein
LELARRRARNFLEVEVVELFERLTSQVHRDNAVTEKGLSGKKNQKKNQKIQFFMKNQSSPIYFLT